MTEQPDTTAIRERWAAWNPAPMAPGGTILALCDALDAARADSDIDARMCVTHRLRAEAAEARIAAALAILRDETQNNRPDAIRALTVLNWPPVPVFQPQHNPGGNK